MHNIKDIRDNIDDFIKLILKRNVKIDKNNIIDLDKNNRKLIQEKEKLEKEKKDISKSKDKTLFEKSKKISLEIEKISKLQSDTKKKLDDIFSSIPNVPLSDVPEGKDESSNVEIEKKGTIKNFGFKLFSFVKRKLSTSGVSLDISLMKLDKILYFLFIYYHLYLPIHLQ